jgi:hypothetical protein
MRWEEIRKVERRKTKEEIRNTKCEAAVSSFRFCL